MIGHPAVREDFPIRPLNLVGKTGRQPLVVSVIVKNSSASITSGNHMINGPCKLQPRRSWHRSALRGSERSRANHRHSNRVKTDNQV